LLMTAEPVDVFNVDTVAAVLAVCGYAVISSDGLAAMRAECLKLDDIVRKGEAPSPWPFELGAVVYPDGSSIEMRVVGFEFDGRTLVKCAYWCNGQCMEGTFTPDRLREPT